MSSLLFVARRAAPVILVARLAGGRVPARRVRVKDARKSHVARAADGLRSSGMRVTAGAVALGLLAVCELFGPHRALARPVPRSGWTCPGGAAGEVVELVNRERRRIGVPPLVVEGRLSAVARTRASRMAEGRRLSHGGWESALRAAGVTSRTIGENIAAGQPSARAVVMSWLGSRGHRANMLDRAFVRIGVGCVVDPDGQRWWVQLFTGR
jgi:uncharacterized protein YkwD